MLGKFDLHPILFEKLIDTLRSLDSYAMDFIVFRYHVTSNEPIVGVEVREGFYSY